PDRELRDDPGRRSLGLLLQPPGQSVLRGRPGVQRAGGGLRQTQGRGPRPGRALAGVEPGLRSGVRFFALLPRRRENGGNVARSLTWLRPDGTGRSATCTPSGRMSPGARRRRAPPPLFAPKAYRSRRCWRACASTTTVLLERWGWMPLG